MFAKIEEIRNRETLNAFLIILSVAFVLFHFYLFLPCNNQDSINITQYMAYLFPNCREENMVDWQSIQEELLLNLWIQF